MAVASTAVFNLTADEIFDSAFARVRGEDVTGYDAKAARRMIQVLLQSWSNRGVNLWTVEQVTTSLVAGQAEYTLDADTVDLLEVVTRLYEGTENQDDLIVERIGRTAYVQTPDKLSQGRPFQWWLDRQRQAPLLYLYPAPDQVYTLFYTKIRRLKDVARFDNEIDLPARFLPAIISGMAYFMGRERPQIDEQKLLRLKQEYEAEWSEAAAEDKERAPLTMTPDFSCYFWN